MAWLEPYAESAEKSCPNVSLTDLVAKGLPGPLNQRVQLEWLFGPRQPAPPDDHWLVAGTRRVRLWFVRNRRARRYILRLRPDGAARVTVPRGGSLC